jgi:hypothetical protein
MDEYDALGGGLAMRHFYACEQPPLAGALRNRYIGANVDPGTPTQATQVLRHFTNT